MSERAVTLALPGADLVERGVRDLRGGRGSAGALLVSIDCEKYHG